MDKSRKTAGTSHDVDIHKVIESDEHYPNPKAAAATVKERLTDPDLQEMDIVDSSQLPELAGWQSTDINGEGSAKKLKDAAEGMKDR